MNSREQLIAYLSTLGALVVVLLGSMLIAALTGDIIIGKMEAFGLGTVTGGLIGLMRLPSARSPVVENAETVNQKP
ncbi:MAG: hypothetical protein EON59_04510 [Alphaproteobacteria bacterium]|nr:MAG: hypothetical protein EON59_04510 [Alphaproteobacteria bacterium]